MTIEEINECIECLLLKGPRLIPVEVIEEMRSVLLDHAEDRDD